MEGGDGGEEQGSSQTGASEPLCLAGKYAGGYEDIVSVEKQIIQESATLLYATHRV